jgi:hypothetical protein
VLEAVRQRELIMSTKFKVLGITLNIYFFNIHNLPIDNAINNKRPFSFENVANIAHSDDFIVPARIREITAIP